MIVKLSTEEGVPLGSNNFEDFMRYIRRFLGANFGFSINVTNNPGGFFSIDDFQFKTFESEGAETQAVFFTPNGLVVEGNLFGAGESPTEAGEEYYRFPVLNASHAGGPNVFCWTLLPEHSISSSTAALQFVNNASVGMQLPYRPLDYNTNDKYQYGYRDLRFNGVPQSTDDVTFSYASPYPTPSGHTTSQSLTFNGLTLGAEHPKPTRGLSSGSESFRYDDSMVDPESGITLQTFESDLGSIVQFEYTNFSIDFGAHVLLWRKDGDNHRFAYVPQDLSSAPEPTLGTFRVLDYASGKIKLNISTEQLEALVFPNESIDMGNLDSILEFVVVSAEHLKEERVGNVGQYHSRYGNIYNGSASDTLLAEYAFDGTSNIVRVIPQEDYSSSSSSSVLLQDVNNRYSDSVILGIRYKAIPNKDEIRRVQTSRYQLDTFQLYYHAGIIKPTATNTNTLRAITKIVPSGWYNRDVLDASYYPVPRVEEAFFFLIANGESLSPFGVTQFNPDTVFSITDTVNLATLGDVGAISNGQVLVYNSGVFTGTNYTLAALNDTTISSVGNNHLLQYISGQWRNRSMQQVLSDTTVSSPINGPIRVSGSPSHNHDLVNKEYVDNAISVGTSGGVSEAAFNSHVNSTSAHSASIVATGNRLILRESDGTAHVTAPSSSPNITPTATRVITDGWIGQHSTREADPHTLMRRDQNGRARVSDPSGSLVTSPATEIVNVGWLRNLSTQNASADTLVSRDSAARFSAASPLANSHVATKGYVDTTSLSSAKFLNTYSLPTFSAGTLSGIMYTAVLLSGNSVDPRDYEIIPVLTGNNYQGKWLLPRISHWVTVGGHLSVANVGVWNASPNFSGVVAPGNNLYAFVKIEIPVPGIVISSNAALTVAIWSRGGMSL